MCFEFNRVWHAHAVWRRRTRRLSAFMWNKTRLWRRNLSLFEVLERGRIMVGYRRTNPIQHEVFHTRLMNSEPFEYNVVLGWTKPSPVQWKLFPVAIFRYWWKWKGFLLTINYPGVFSFGTVGMTPSYPFPFAISQHSFANLIKIIQHPWQFFQIFRY